MSSFKKALVAKGGPRRLKGSAQGSKMPTYGTIIDMTCRNLNDITWYILMEPDGIDGLC